jgi:hypothetical protein
MLLSHKGSTAGASDRDGNSRSGNSDDELTMSESDTTKKVKVAVAATAAGMASDFGLLTISENHVRVMEGMSYFTTGSTRAPGSELVPEPRVDEVVVFKDLFAARLRMSPHPVLADILYKFQVCLRLGFVCRRILCSCGGSTLHQPCMDQVCNGRMNHIFEVVGEKYVRQTKHAARGAQKLKVVETWEAEAARSKTKDAKRWKRASL